MKKITIILILITSITFGQTYTVDNAFNPTNDTGLYNQNIGSKGVLLNSGKILTTEGENLGYTGIYRINNDGSIDNSFTKIIVSGTSDRFFANPIQGNFILVYGNTSTDSTTLKSYDENGVLVTQFANPIFTKSNTPFNGTTTYGGGSISKIFFLNDGKFLIFGVFNFVNGVSCNNIVRLNTNGTVDTSFIIGTGFSGGTTAFAMQPDGKYVVGGYFSSYNGVSKGMIARLNSNGLLDTSFDVNTLYSSFGVTNGYNRNGPINDILVQPDGKIITSGTDLYLNGINYRRNIVRLNSNGTTDNTFKLNYFSNLYTNVVRYNSDGNIYFLEGTSIKKCNNLGNIISTFNDANADGGGNSSDFIIQNNKLVVVGNYRNLAGITRLGYHRLNSNGSIDLTFNPHFGPNTSYFNRNGSIGTELYANTLPDNKILIHGAMTSYNDIPVKSMIRLTENGEIDPTFIINPSIVNVALIDNSDTYGYNPIQTNKNYDGKLYVKVNFIDGKKIIKLNYDGSIDTNFNFYRSIEDFKITNDNKILATGVQNGLKKIIRYNSDCSVDNTFISPTFNNFPSYLELLDDNKILVSLGTDGYNNNNNYLIRLNENGTLDNTFSLTYNGYNIRGIYKTKTINGKIYVHGAASPFYPYSGSNFLMRYNADWTMDNTFIPISTNNYKFLSNERTITDSPTVNNYRMYRINDSNGNQSSTFSSGIINQIEQKLNSQNCENLIFCGGFNKVNNLNKHNLFRLTVQNSIIIPTPTGELNQLFTQGQTLANLIVNGQNIQWYNSQNECAFNASGRNSNQFNGLPINTTLMNGTTYYASQTINGIESNQRLPITVNLSLGTSELTLSNLKLFPNPIKDKLYISNSSSIGKIEIYNLIGQKIFENSFIKDEINIDLNNYKKGIYLLKIFSEGKIHTEKIVKN